MTVAASVPRSRWFTAIFLLVLAASDYLAYRNVLGGPFLFDDVHEIQENLAIRMGEVRWDTLQRAVTESPLKRRAVANLFNAFNYRLSARQAPEWHLVNLAIHGLCGLTLFFLIRTALSFPGLRERVDRPEWAAATGALLWSLHPVQTEAVSYIIQRMTSLMTLFYLAAMLAYLAAARAQGRMRQIAGYAAAGGLWLLALGSKENAVMLPLCLLWFETCFPSAGSAERRKWIVGVGGVAGVIGAIFLGPTVWEHVRAGYPTLGFTPAQRLLTEARMVLSYLTVLAWPSPSLLTLDRFPRLSLSLFDPPATLWAVAAVTAGLAFAALYVRRFPLAAFLIGWYALNLALESSVVPLELYFEHRLYLPSAALLAALGAALAARPAVRRWGIPAAVAVALMFGLLTQTRNRVWTDPEAMWRDAVRKTPMNPRPWYNLGTHYLEARQFPRAEWALRRVIQLRPDYAEAYNNLGSLAFAQGRMDQAEALFDQALKARPDLGEGYIGKGNQAHAVGDVNAAMKNYEQGLIADPNNPSAWYNLALTYFDQGMAGPAKMAVEKALELEPDYALAWVLLGNIQFGQGRFEQAEAGYRQALALDPNNLDAANNLANALFRQGETDEAIERLEALVARAPKEADFLDSLCEAYLAGRQWDSAESSCRKALELNPGLVSSMIHLADSLAARGRTDEARKALEGYISRYPEAAELRQALERLKK